MLAGCFTTSGKRDGSVQPHGEKKIKSDKKFGGFLFKNKNLCRSVGFFYFNIYLFREDCRDSGRQVKKISANFLWKNFADSRKIRSM